MTSAESVTLLANWAACLWPRGMLGGDWASALRGGQTCRLLVAVEAGEVRAEVGLAVAACDGSWTEI